MTNIFLDPPRWRALTLMLMILPFIIAWLIIYRVWTEGGLIARMIWRDIKIELEWARRAWRVAGRDQQ